MRVKQRGREGPVFSALTLVVVLLSSCALNPNVPSPQLAVPARYRATPASAKQAWPNALWWQNFDSPELNRLIVHARANNLDIAVAVAKVREADAEIRVAGAPLFPTLQGQGSASRSYRSNTAATNTQFNNLGLTRNETQNTYQATLNASYEVDFWGKNRAALKSARQSAIATRFDQATVALGVDASVASTYFTVVALRDQLKIAQDNLASAEQILKVIKAEISVGTASALDLAQQQTQVATQRAQIPPIKQSIEENINALAILLGEPPERLDIEDTNPIQITVPTVAAGLPSQLLERRPDVAEAQANLAAARATVQESKAALFPSLNLTAEGGFESSALHTLFDPASKFYDLMAGLTQPIFEGGQLRGQLKVSRAQYMELLADYRKTVISAFEDVDNALVDVRQTAAQEKLQASAVAVAKKAFRISQAQLHEGVTDLTTVLNTEQSLFSAQDQLAQDRLARLKATISLYQALGGGWSRTQAEQAIKNSDMPSY